METNHRVMVVCEDPAILGRLGKHLCEQNFDVRCVSSAAEAISCCAAWSAELVICDDHLTEMKGLALIESIRRQNPHTRFILITPPGETPEFSHFQPKRTIAFLGKPFNPKDLMHYVHRAVGLSESPCNRREHNRHPFDVDTHCILINPFDDSESRSIPALMRDISRSGATMIVHQAFPVPAMLKFIFHLPQQQHTVNMLAKSMSCTLTQIAGVYRLGAKFIGLLPKEAVDAIRQMKQNSNATADEDIFTGKSFHEAVREWLAQHHQDFNAIDADSTPNVADIAAEVCRDPQDETPTNIKDKKST